MIVLVCGGRDITTMYYPRLFNTLDDIHRRSIIDVIIHGGARGADEMSGEWALDNDVHVAVVEAQWKSFGKSAGHRRNAAMASLNPDLCVALPGGKGTASMVAICKRKGIEVLEVT